MPSWSIGDLGAEAPPGREFGLRVEVCGDVTLTGPAGTTVRVRGRQPQAVTALLALERRPVVRDELAEALWGERLSGHWQGALRGVLSKVRAELVAAGLPATILRSEDTKIWLDEPGTVRTDVADAEALLETAEAALASGDPGGASVAAADAARVFTRPFLPHNDSDWSRRQRESLAAGAARAAQLQASALLADGHAADAARSARARLVEEPLDEAMHHLLISALVADGRHAAAVEAFADLADLLWNEYGIAPAAETAALLERVERVRRVERPVPYQLDDDVRFVGRAPEWAALEAAWQDVVARGRPRMVVVRGPAGIGKTRLASRMCQPLAAEGRPVLWGRSRSEDGRAYGALAEAIDAALERNPAVLDRLGARAAGLVRLLPRLADRFEDYRPPADDALARTHLFASAAAVVSELAAEPAVLVLDDLHWASDDTIALLEFVVDSLERPLLIVATARETITAGRVAEIRRVIPVETLSLQGLSVDELAELVVGHPAPFAPDQMALAVTLHERTAGLPFFIAEVAQAARDAGDPIDPDTVPGAVRDWVTRGLASLPAFEAEVLELASVLGPDVDVALLQRVAAGEAPPHEAAVDALVARGLLRTTGRIGVLAFSHAIVRDIVYDRLGPARRARLHRRIGDAIAAGPSVPDHNATLAHHYQQSGADRRAPAAAHAHHAGQEALAQGAWERAATHFDASLRSADTPVARARALVGFGQARLRQGRFAEARRVLHEAVDVSSTNRLPFELAEATLALVGRAGRGVSPHRPQQVERLRSALGALERTDPSPSTPDGIQRRTMLLSDLERELAMSLLLSDAAAERNALLERSLAHARALPEPDPSVLAAAILALRMQSLDTYTPQRRLAHIDEVLALPAARMHPEQRIEARVYQHEDRLQLGDRAGAASSLKAADALVASYPHPYWHWALGTWRCLSALADGNLDRAEALALEAAAHQPGVEEAEACLGVNLVNIRLLQGRADEVIGLLRAATEDHPEIPCYRAVLALCAADSGEHQLARDAYTWFARDRFAALPEDTNRYLGLTVLAHVAADLGDEAGAAVLSELLSPHRGQLVLLNCYGGGGATWGPASWALARLAATEGRDADAATLFAEAATESAHSPAFLERIAASR